MRKFIRKSIFILFFAVISAFLTLFCLGIFNVHDKILFISNSISYNAKSSFVKKHKSQLENSDYIIIGSSISLNNINGNYLESLIKSKVINLASWGARIEDFYEYIPYFNIKSKIIINIGFNDFGKSSIKKYSGFPLDSKNDALNKILNLNSFLIQKRDIKEYTDIKSRKTYKSLIFDNTGSVSLEIDSSHVDKNRWDETRPVPKDNGIDYMIQELSKFKDFQVYFFFSPERKKYKTKIKQNVVNKMQQRICYKLKNVHFFNLYDLNFDDSLFADCTHFNDQGASVYAEKIAHMMKGFVRDNKIKI